jgi:hypothetical protein
MRGEQSEKKSRESKTPQAEHKGIEKESMTTGADPRHPLKTPSEVICAAVYTR